MGTGLSRAKTSAMILRKLVTNSILVAYGSRRPCGVLVFRGVMRVERGRFGKR